MYTNDQLWSTLPSYIFPSSYELSSFKCRKYVHSNIHTWLDLTLDPFFLFYFFTGGDTERGDTKHALRPLVLNLIFISKKKSEKMKLPGTHWKWASKYFNVPWQGSPKSLVEAGTLQFCRWLHLWKKKKQKQKLHIAIIKIIITENFYIAHLMG